MVQALEEWLLAVNHLHQMEPEQQQAYAKGKSTQSGYHHGQALTMHCADLMHMPVSGDHGRANTIASRVLATVWVSFDVEST